MELTQLTNTNNLQNSYEVNKSVHSNNPLNTKESKEHTYADKIEKSIGSDFASNLSSNIKMITELQKQHSSISMQLEITHEIVNSVDQSVKFNKVALDDQQPKISHLLNDFNNFSKTSKIPEISDKPGIYFDGQIGSKPLSSQEIYNQVHEKQERLALIRKAISHEIESVSENAMDSISKEKDTVEIKFKFKNVDFKQESLEFSSDSLSNFKGQMISSQAHALPLHSEQLLA